MTVWCSHMNGYYFFMSVEIEPIKKSPQYKHTVIIVNGNN